jgi:hypothetical protein
MHDLRLEFPVVLKPDIGERGDGVAVIRSLDEAKRYLESAEEAVLVQRYVPGVEVTINYYRHPGEERGRIFAITEKRTLELVGDGASSLERLILANDHAVNMAKYFLAQHADRLDEIPSAGEVVALGELGSHRRGAVFLDGEHLRSDVLEAAIDQVSQSFPGFWFGRYDIRAESLATLRRGERFSVIELSGAFSESTNIYDPKYRLGDAYRMLRRQWSLLFEIADANTAAGASPTSWAELANRWKAHRRARRGHAT